MKQIKCIVFLHLLLPCLLMAQPNIDRNRDMQWILGYESWANSTQPNFGGIIIDFNTGVPNPYFHYTNMNFFHTSAGLCDTSGQLFCYTNGIYMANRNDNVMLHGDSLGYGAFWQQDRQFGLSATQAFAVVLPVPCQEHCAVVFYKHLTSDPNGMIAPLGASYANIDLQGDNGLGAITQKELPIIRDTIYGTHTACRHGNGRDWWIINPKYKLDKYYKTLLNPYGVHNIAQQAMPKIGSSGCNQACFSPNGEKYVHNDVFRGVWLYDFDRCTGMLSNRKLLPIPRPYPIIAFGVAFSPNSRYLYVTSDTAVTQYDTQASNIDASKQVVTHFDYAQDQGSYMPFMLMQLAPDGKIYINSHNGIHYFHVIDKPDLAGAACNVIQHGLRLPCIYNETMPNFPNFRLGALKNSPCDSLGIEAGVTVGTKQPPPEKEDFTMHLFPNPATDYTLLLWDAPLAAAAELAVSDAIGQVVYHTTLPKETTYYKLPLQNLPVGVYIATLHGAGFKVSQKIIHLNP